MLYASKEQCPRTWLTLGRMTCSFFAVFAASVACSSSSKKDSNAGPANCSTNSAWLNGDEESPLMHPGGNCIECHSRKGEGPIYAIAGTVQGAATDNIDCNGIAGVTVSLLGSNGKTLDLTSNAAGNFFSSSTSGLTAPYRVTLTKGEKTVSMSASQTDFNCASCHADGSNVTNRIYFDQL